MKRFLASSLAVKIAVAIVTIVALAYVVTHAAVPVGTGLSSPVMTNFNARYFTITLAAGTTPTNVIQLNLPMGPGSPDLPGDIINIVNGTNLWTNDLGNLRPRVVQTQLNASNIVSHESLTSEGAFDITSTYTGILTLGSNSVPVFQNSYILLSTDAASTDPTLRTVYLSGMASQGQLLFLENVLGNAGTTTSAFQLTNGTPCYDVPTMTVALQNGNWSSTNAGESLFLQFDGISGWREVSRFFGALGGSGNSLWTNDAGILHPKDLTLPVMITNQLQLGPGSTNVLYRNADNQIVLTNGAITNGLSIVNGSNRVMHLGFKPLPNTDPRISSSSGFLWLNAVTILEGNLQPDSDLTRDIGNFSSSGGFRNTYVKGTNYTIGMNDGLGNYSRMAVYQVGTNTPLVFDQETSGTAGYSRGFSFRTNGVEIFSATGTGGPSSGANWVASGTTNSTLAGTATMLKSIDAHNAKYWGAVGNGTANDTVSLQAGLNYVGTNGGGWFYIPSGTYAITNSLVITNSGVHVFGDGVGKTILKEVDGTRPGVTVNGAGIYATLSIVAVTNCSVESLTVDHRSTTNECSGITMEPDGAGYAGVTPKNCTIRNCEVLGLGTTHEYLIWSLRGESIHIENNFCDGGVPTDTGFVQQEGIEVFGGTNVWVTGNTVRNVAGTGLNIGTTFGVTNASMQAVVVAYNSVSNCRLGANLGTGWDATNGNNDLQSIKVEGNLFKTLWVGGIYCFADTNGTMRDVRITGNSISNVVGAGAFGLYCIGNGRQVGSNNWISAFRIENNTWVAITNTTTSAGVVNFSYWGGTTFSRNHIIGGKYYGIDIASQTTNCVISDNVIEQSWATGIWCQDAGEITISGNSVLLPCQGGSTGAPIQLGTATNCTIRANSVKWDAAVVGEYPAVYITTGTTNNIFGNSLLYTPTRADSILNNGGKAVVGLHSDSPVGILTNAPSEALEVVGNIKASGSVNAASYQISGINGWTGFWTNMIPGVITQRICISGGATTNVITL